MGNIIDMIHWEIWRTFSSSFEILPVLHKKTSCFFCMFKDSFVNGPQWFAKGKKKQAKKSYPIPQKQLKIYSKNSVLLTCVYTSVSEIQNS